MMRKRFDLHRFRYKKSLLNLFDISNVIILTIALLVSIYPFYYILIYSLSDANAAAKFGVLLAPRGFTFQNYIRMLASHDLSNYILMSVLRTMMGTIVTIFCCSLFSYILTKPEMYLRRFIYRITIITMYVNAGLIPQYLTYRMYGLRNSFLVYILPFAVNAFFIILLKTFMEQLPASLEESAMMDGAGYFTIFRKIIFPLSKPIIATITVFSAVSQWNSWFDTYIYIRNERLFTLQYILLQYLQEAQRLADMMRKGGTSAFSGNASAVSPYSVRMTITMITVLPILFVYPFMQRYFIKGIMLGAIKG